ncbi:MAG: helix-turn-helix domain-containing protein [Pseudomonadota bacterium]
MKNEPGREFPLVSAHYIAAFARFMQAEGISPDVLLDGTGVPIEALTQPEVYLSIAQVQRVFEQGCRLVPRDSLGFEFGRTADLTLHGLLGFSILRREKLRELVALVVTVIRVRMPLMEIRLSEDGAHQHLVLEDTWDFGSARAFVTGMYLGGIHTLASLATRDIRLEFDHPAPRSRRGFGQLQTASLSFDRPQCRATLTYRGLPAWQTENRAPELIARLGVREAPVADETDVVLRLRQCILAHPGRHCTLEEVADRLGMSPRSLRRHLQDAGQSFSDIRNSIRMEFARRLLRGSTLPIDEIADRVGYGDQASFSKAFSACTGISPGRFRRSGNTLDDTLSRSA